MPFDVGAFVALQSAGPQGVAPSKKSVKVKSGRQSRRRWRGQQTLQSAGGMANLAKAIYAPSDHEMCVTVEPQRGMRDGKPFRNPQVTQGWHPGGRGA